MTSAGPLAGVTVAERPARRPCAVTRAAIGFAGLLCVRFGARVLRMEESPDDAVRLRSAIPRDGSSAVDVFLTGGKEIVPPGSQPGADLVLTDDPDLARAWPDGRIVLVRPARDGRDDWSELTLQAASGLLDIFGDADRGPLPLPGHLVSYAAGMAAFDALIAAHLAGQRGVPVEPSEVSVLDVALWVNWKHILAAEQGLADAGLERSEDWTTIGCRDGHVVLTFQDKDVGKIARMIGDDRLLAPEFRTRAGRQANVAAFHAMISAWMIGRSRAEIVETARSLAIPIGPVVSPDELPHDAQMRHRRFVRETSPCRGMPELPLLWDGVRPGCPHIVDEDRIG